VTEQGNPAGDDGNDSEPQYANANGAHWTPLFRCRPSVIVHAIQADATHA
jgi:hypothetical protein